MNRVLIAAVVFAMAPAGDGVRDSKTERKK
jgi:hypothetical protein